MQLACFAMYLVVQIWPSYAFLQDSNQLQSFLLDTPFSDFELSIMNVAFKTTPNPNVTTHTSISTVLGTTNKHPTKEVNDKSELTSGPLSFDVISSVKLPAPSDSHLYLEILFNIKPHEPHGVIYLLGTAKHFFAVYLENAYIIVHFALGIDETILSSEHPLSLDSWHKVEIWRSGNAALLKINKQPWVEGGVKKANDNINNQFAYFGEVPRDEAPTGIPLHLGFSGCIEKIYINGRYLHLHSEAIISKNVHPCGWDACEGEQCYGGAQCILWRATPYCRCKYPSYGHRCKNKHTEAPLEMKFSRFSYLRLSSRQVMKHVTGENLNLVLSISINEQNMIDASKLESPDQVLVYTGDGENVGDYMHLLLTARNEVKLLLNLGSGPIALLHPTVLTFDHLWHNISINRKERHVTLSVDNVSINAICPAPSIELNVYDSIYIGGIQSLKANLLGFNGCIRDVQVDTERIDMKSNDTEAVNIMSCSE